MHPVTSEQKLIGRVCCRLRFYWYTQLLTQQDSIEAFLDTPIQGSKLQKVDNKLFPLLNNYPHPSFAAEEVEGSGGSSNTSGSLGLLLLGTTALRKRTKLVIRMYSHCRKLSINCVLKQTQVSVASLKFNIAII